MPSTAGYPFFHVQRQELPALQHVVSRSALTDTS